MSVRPYVKVLLADRIQFVKESVTQLLICHPGRPMLNIPCSCIESLMELNFTSSEIASILSVSRSTICRQIRQYGLSYSRNYCCISDANLDELVRGYVCNIQDVAAKLGNYGNYGYVQT